MPLREAVVEAGRARLRPIVMNSITTMLAITPMMLGFGQGTALQAPLAIAIFGGLFTSTALTLVVIPVVYETLDDVRDRVLRVAGAGRGGATAATAAAHAAASAGHAAGAPPVRPAPTAALAELGTATADRDGATP
jgi:hypothetical protein